MSIVQLTSLINGLRKTLPAEAAIVHTKPMIYLLLDSFPVSLESLWNTSSIDEKLRRTRELAMNGVNFCPLRKYENKALKASWLAQINEYVETGRNLSPKVYNIQFAAKNVPIVVYIITRVVQEGFLATCSGCSGGVFEGENRKINGNISGNPAVWTSVAIHLLFPPLVK